MDDNLLDITTLIDTAINMRVMKELQPEKEKIGYSEKYWKLKYQITKEIANRFINRLDVFKEDPGKILKDELKRQHEVVFNNKG